MNRDASDFGQFISLMKPKRGITRLRSGRTASAAAGSTRSGKRCSHRLVLPSEHEFKSPSRRAGHLARKYTVELAAA
jgi:hypothetical protein